MQGAILSSLPYYIFDRVRFQIRVQPFGSTRFVTGVRKLIIESNFVVVLLATRIVKDLVLVVNITSSKAKKLYTCSHTRSQT